MDFSNTVTSFGYHLFQVIDKKLSSQNEQSLIGLFNFLMPSLSFLLLFFAGVLLYFACSLVFSYFKKFKKQSLQFKILSFAYLLFLFFICQFFNGNLNTSKIIVDDSDLLYSKQQILETKKEFCFIEKSNAEVDYFAKVSLK